MSINLGTDRQYFSNIIIINIVDKSDICLNKKDLNRQTDLLMINYRINIKERKTKMATETSIICITFCRNSQQLKILTKTSPILPFWQFKIKIYNKYKI